MVVRHPLPIDVFLSSATSFFFASFPRPLGEEGGETDPPCPWGESNLSLSLFFSFSFSLSCPLEL